MWEGACPRWQSVSQQIHLLTHRNRGQAPSHTSLPVSSFKGYYHVPRPSLQLRVLPDQDRCWA
ncbi:hypothetical protein DYL61_02200 [Pseudomonas nabeulensis]|uniref:Uncharacterized protein n=1 Tax=Pseudomonas nabeulensis TaxID=2293833 RepID=A0A4Z0BBI0_9PSED|nr:hypothetical protein DYL61_02200 [Pseudomonas nabeulensis]